jgi:tRNA(Ile)-lysidine synthase
VLLALFRGAGPAGLAGIPARRRLAAACDLARPLLRFRRSRLREYVLGARLPFVVDASNDDAAYRRNALRQSLEALRADFPALDEAVARTAEVVGAELAELPEAALRRKVRDALRAREALGDVGFGHVEAAVRALKQGRSGRFSMGSRAEMTIEGGALTVHRKE